MSKEMNEFLSVGLNRYKEAHNVYWRFRKELTDVLVATLDQRKNYGSFIIKENSFYTQPWVNGLMLNARVSGHFNGIEYSIGIGLDWYNSEVDLPIAFACIEKSNRDLINLDKNYNWTYKVYDRSLLGYFSSYKFENLELVFNSLIDDIIEYMDAEFLNK